MHSRYLWTVLTTLALALGNTARTVAAEDAEHQAEVLREAGGIRGGILVHAGCGDGVLTKAWGKSGAFLVHGLEANPKLVESAREGVYAVGLAGRVGIECHAGGELPYADNMVNLLVVQALPERAAAGLNIQELLRVLVPRGVVLLEAGAWNDAELKRFADAGGVAIEPVKLAGRWVKLVKPLSAELDEWTHDRHNPARTATSRDAQVGPVASLRWLDGPGRSRAHNARPVSAVSAGGRFFYLYDSGQPFVAVPSVLKLVARDAFNGQVLWSLDIPGAVSSDSGPNARTMVASGEVLYAVLKSKGPLVKLDAASGKTLHTYAGTAPDEVILVEGKLLLLERAKVRCLDAASGAEVWSQNAGKYDNRLAAAEGCVYVHATRTAQVYCFGLADGKQRWMISDARMQRGAAMAGVLNGTLVMATSSELAGYGPDGAQRWKHAYAASGRGSAWNTFFSQGLVWAHDVGDDKAKRPDAWIGLDPVSGALKKTFPAQFQDKCALGKATEKYLITGRVHFFDTGTGAVEFPQIARGACGFGVVPANGMIYTFPTDCLCFPMLYGTMALAPQPVPTDGDMAARWDRGPAFDLVSNQTALSGDWPCYRHDARRSGAASTVVASGARFLWQTDLVKAGAVTPPVAALGKVFVAATDEQTLHALDAASGKPVWRFTANGRITSPPAIQDGHCLVGCEAGWVYALDARNGALAWRYRVAPGGRRIMAYGRLASPWPIAGGVLVDGGRVYAVAGRSGNLDGGLAVAALDLKTGKPVWEQRVKDGALADLLVKGGEKLFMYRHRFDPQTGASEKWKDAAAVDVLRGGTPLIGSVWANRTAWHKSGSQGQLLVFNDAQVFGVSAFVDLEKYTQIRPEAGDFRLFAKPVAKLPTGGWTVKLPVQVRSLVLAGDVLFAAGIPDVKGGQGGVLWAVNATTGERLAELKLPAAPVLDGLIGANERLYLSTVDGGVVCLGP